MNMVIPTGSKQSKKGLPKRTGKRGRGGAKHGMKATRQKPRGKQPVQTGVYVPSSRAGALHDVGPLKRTSF